MMTGALEQYTTVGSIRTRTEKLTASYSDQALPIDLADVPQPISGVSSDDDEPSRSGGPSFFAPPLVGKVARTGTGSSFLLGRAILAGSDVDDFPKNDVILVPAVLARGRFGNPMAGNYSLFALGNDFLKLSNPQDWPWLDPRVFAM